MKLDAAWLIRWEWGSDSQAVRCPVVGILSPDTDAEIVRMHLQWLHDRYTCTLRELAQLAGPDVLNPERVHVLATDDQEEPRWMEVGGNLALQALRVENIEVEGDNIGGEVEILSYNERLPGGAVQRQELTQRTNCAEID